ncbi:hypothetical protein [Microbacterium soli]|uniref:Uncharacterized protein n=1 Tax=Microbacterium soli TaxID=446075 RepID=A0ABP7NIU1_9MICO
MSTLLDEETVVLDALDFEIPCARGGHDAEFFVKCRGCDLNAGNLCARHLANVRRRVEDIVRAGIFIPRCAFCGRPAMSFDEAYKVVPL